MTGTENGDQATMSERKSDDQQKEENYAEDRSKRERKLALNIDLIMSNQKKVVIVMVIMRMMIMK